MRFELSTRTMITAVLVVLGAWVLVRLLPVALVLIGALVVIGALDPLVSWLEARRVGRKTAIAIVFGAGFGLTALMLFFTIPALVAQVRDLVSREPEIRRQVVGFLQHSPFTSPLAAELENLDYRALLKASPMTVLTATGRGVEILAYAVAAIFLALYMMIDRDRLRGGLFALVPRNHHVRFSRVLVNLETIVGGYIRGQVITCALMAAFILVLLLACRVPNALAIAVIGGVMDVLPYIGVFLTMGPAVVAAYGQGPVIAVVVFAVLLVYEEFESRILVPLVYGRALRLPSSVVFFSLLAGAALAGLMGALLALPLAAAVVMLLDELRVDLPGETIQPADLAQRREDKREERAYEQRVETVPLAEAAGIAVEIARERKQEEKAVEKAAEQG